MGATEPQQDDWRLLARSAEGDGEAFRVLVERHQDRLVRLCERLLGERGAALEAAQEVFLKAWRKAGSLEPRGRLYTWLYRVATNHCLNQLRRRRIVRFLPLAAPGSERGDEPAAIDPPDRAPDAQRGLEAKRRWRATRRAIAALPATQRVVLLLAKFEGLSYREIAETLGITEGAVESRLFRTMRRLERAQESARPAVSRGEES